LAQYIYPAVVSIAYSMPLVGYQLDREIIRLGRLVLVIWSAYLIKPNSTEFLLGKITPVQTISPIATHFP